MFFLLLHMVWVPFSTELVGVETLQFMLVLANIGIILFFALHHEDNAVVFQGFVLETKLGWSIWFTRCKGE